MRQGDLGRLEVASRGRLADQKLIENLIDDRRREKGEVTMGCYGRTISSGRGTDMGTVVLTLDGEELRAIWYVD